MDKSRLCQRCRKRPRVSKTVCQVCLTYVSQRQRKASGAIGFKPKSKTERAAWLAACGQPLQ